MPRKQKSLLSYKKFKPATKGPLFQALLALLSKMAIEGGIKLVKQLIDLFTDS